MGTGSGSFRKKGNGYEYRVWVTGPDGTPIQKSFTGKTKVICRQKHEEYIKHMDDVRIEEQTLGAFAEKWIDAKRSMVSYRTWKNYNNYLQNYVLKSLNPKKQISSFKPMDIERMLAQCSHLSDSAKHDILLTAKQLFEAAVRNDYILANPCRNVTIRKTDEIKEVAVFTPDEIKVIEDAIATSPIGTGIALMLYAGLRTEEVCALHWEDVDLENSVIHVCRKIIIDEYGVCKDVRSTKSRRERYVPFGQKLLDVLNNTERIPSVPYVVPYRAAKKTYKYNYIFYTPHVFFERYESFFKTLPIRYLSPHKMRHTYGTYLVRSGADLPSVQNLLGHSSITMTRIYANVDLTDQKNAVSKLKFT